MLVHRLSVKFLQNCFFLVFAVENIDLDFYVVVQNESKFDFH